MSISLRSTATIALATLSFALLELVPVHASPGGSSAAYIQHQVSPPMDVAPSAAAAELVVIAHNAGDAPSTIVRAVAAHARVVEIDTTLAGTKLRARHDVLPRSATDIVNKSQTVGQAWAASATSGILLDLKTHGAATSRLVSALISSHPNTRVFASTPNRQTLDALAVTNPGVLRLLSVPSAGALAAFLQRPIDPAIQGVAIAERLLDPATVNKLAGHHLWIQAWTVNTMRRVNALAALGINGVTTDNLTILSALQPGQTAIAARTSSSEPSPPSPVPVMRPDSST